MLDGLPADGEFDLVDAFAVRLPLQVIVRAARGAAHRRAWLLDCLVQAFGVSDPANGLPISERVRVMEELGAYAHELGRLRLDDPRDDLTTVLVNAEVEDDDGGRHRLQPGDYARFFSTLAAAGSETSRNGIAHGVWLLDRHPEQRAVLLADPDGVFPTAVEEIVRYASPVMHMRRNVARDTELAGQPLTAGDRVVIWYRSANHDETVFERPERFDVTRSPNDHLGYGAGGPHFCLGAHLARMEMNMQRASASSKPTLSEIPPGRRLASAPKLALHRRLALTDDRDLAAGLHDRFGGADHQVEPLLVHQARNHREQGSARDGETEVGPHLLGVALLRPAQILGVETGSRCRRRGWGPMTDRCR